MIDTATNPLVVAIWYVALFIRIAPDDNNLAIAQQKDGIVLGCGNIDDIGECGDVSLAMIITSPCYHGFVAQECNGMPAGGSDFDHSSDIRCVLLPVGIIAPTLDSAIAH